MGLFICFKKPKYKNVLHTEIETELVNRFGYNTISQEECVRLINLILKATDSTGSTFCKKFGSTGNSQGINTAMMAGHSTGDDTILILSNKDSIEEVHTADDIRSVLIFNYEEDEEDEEEKNELDIHILCSNQITNSGGSKILLQNLIDISREKGVKTISLVSSKSAINYYENFGFELVSDLNTFMTLQLGGNNLVRLVLKLFKFNKKYKKYKKFKKFKTSKTSKTSKKYKKTFKKYKKTFKKYKKTFKK